MAVLLAPVLPTGAQRIWQQLGCEGKVSNQRLDELKWGQLKPGTKVCKAEPIFPRLDKALTLAKLEEMAEADRNRDKPKEKSKPVEIDKKQESEVRSQEPGVSTGYGPGVPTARSVAPGPRPR